MEYQGIRPDTQFLWMSLEELTNELSLHRHYQTLQFVQETAKEIIGEEALNRFSSIDLKLLSRLAEESFIKNFKSLTPNNKQWHPQLIHIIHEFFYVCRRLTLEDQETVGFNFKATRI